MWCHTFKAILHKICSDFQANVAPANHDSFLGNLLGFLHVGYQRISIIHIPQVMNALQMCIFGTKAVQGDILHAYTPSSVALALRKQLQTVHG